MLRSAIQDAISLSFFELGSFNPELSTFGQVSTNLVFGKVLASNPLNELEISVYHHGYKIAIFDSKHLTIDKGTLEYWNCTEEEFFQFSLIHNLYDLEFKDIGYIKRQYQLLGSMSFPIITRVRSLAHMRNRYTATLDAALTEQYTSTATTREALRRMYVQQGGNPDDLFPRTK